MADTYWIVWNCDEKGEGVIFDNEKDAIEASNGDRSQMGSSLAYAFNDMYGENGPLPVQKVEV